MLPVVRHHAATSFTEPASVASSSIALPGSSSRMAWAVLTIGIGHESPRASIHWVISRTGITVSFASNRSDEDDVAVAGREVEGGDPFHTVDERIEIGL